MQQEFKFTIQFISLKLIFNIFYQPVLKNSLYTLVERTFLATRMISILIDMPIRFSRVYEARSDKA